MSALIGPARAARILGETFAASCAEATGLGAPVDVVSMLGWMGTTYIRAANTMEQAMRDDSNAFERLRRGAEVLRQGGQS